MLRIALLIRVLFGFVAVLLLAWLGLIAFAYLVANERQSDINPAPSATQVAALVTLLDAAEAGDRETILAAVHTNRLDARILSDETPLSVGETPDSAAMALANEVSRLLPGRPFSVDAIWLPPRQERWLPGRPNGIEFRMKLASGELLVVDTRSPVVMTGLGLPVGFGAGLGSALLALIAVALLISATRPLVRLAAAVDSLEPGSAPIDLPDSRTVAPEIRAIAQAIIRLQDRLSSMLATRMVLIGGISHDVRTFATRLRLRVEKIGDPEERAAAGNDIDDMIRLLDDAMLAARVGAGEQQLEMIDFRDIVADLVADRQAVGQPVELAATPAQPTFVLGDALALKRVVGNLTDNAVKYGQQAILTLELSARHATLHVDDRGAGIPTDQRQAVLEPFVRLEQSRNRSTGGAGLGLAVARNLAEGHGGTLTIGDAPTGGARFTLQVPLMEMDPG
ncbi:ATP-binding protein [Oryzibacter oryziterrae]|uniref:ATP-binding protein n=1 Tax=Oryzibacter oryziterrae TaxID=2766474 RepID=UPI001F2AF47D|nr:ATP-binding protein [Oryzibacter oryziterrae]